MSNSLPSRPQWVDGLEVNEVDDGLVVYQAEPEQVHYLNSTAAVVFMLCRDQSTVTDIAVQVGKAFSLEEEPISETRACLEQLQAKGVIR